MVVKKGTKKKGMNAARRTATAVAVAGGSPAKRRVLTKKKGSSAKLRGPATKKGKGRSSTTVAPATKKGKGRTNAKHTTVAAAMKVVEDGTIVSLAEPVSAKRRVSKLRGPATKQGGAAKRADAKSTIAAKLAAMKEIEDGGTVVSLTAPKPRKRASDFFDGDDLKASVFFTDCEEEDNDDKEEDEESDDSKTETNSLDLSSESDGEEENTKEKPIVLSSSSLERSAGESEDEESEEELVAPVRRSTRSASRAMNMFNTIVVAVATLCATATAASIPLVWLDGGGSHQQQQQQRRAGTYKFGKKQNVVQQCTPDQFMGDYKYMNCQDVETKVGIMCDNDNGTNQCDYKEKPMNDDNGDDVCFVEGSFDATDIIMDPARPGVCQLKFVALKDSCKAEALPVGFGIKAEVDMTAGPDDTSTLVLWFSNDGGVVYYNEDEPQEPVFLHQDLSKGRKLGGCSTCNPKIQICPCDPNIQNNCGDDYCATESEWEDGCAKCLCYEQGNGSWCDGTNNEYYDTYFEQHGVNPWGDGKRENRKCNEGFLSLYDPWFGATKTKENICHHDWQCGSGFFMFNDKTIFRLKCLSIWEDEGSSYCVEPPQKERTGPEWVSFLMNAGESCDPQWPHGCKNENIAGFAWKDGCAACRYYKNGNDAWCDGTRNEYYDKYFDENDENPYGFKEKEDRKCNTKFKTNDQECWSDWQCGNGQYCGWNLRNDRYSYSCVSST